MTKRDSERVMDAVFQTLGELLTQGDRLQVSGFGVFHTKLRGPRTARNPRTGTVLPLPEAKVAVFKPSLALKEGLNGSGDRISTERRE